jgi:hypothetical protein
VADYQQSSISISFSVYEMGDIMFHPDNAYPTVISWFACTQPILPMHADAFAFTMLTNNKKCFQNVMIFLCPKLCPDKFMRDIESSWTCPRELMECV